MYLLQPGAGTIKPDIISSLIMGGSDGGGGQTNESIMSSVTRIMPTRSGGSVRDELKIARVEKIMQNIKKSESHAIKIVKCVCTWAK